MLKGTDKQIAWAEQIKADKTRKLKDRLVSMQERIARGNAAQNIVAIGALMELIYSELIKHIDTIDTASEWIDNRTNMVANQKLIIKIIKTNKDILSAYTKYRADKIIADSDCEYLISKAFA
jgi:hypothetical protein